MLSLFSTTAEENQTLGLLSSPKQEESLTEDESMEVDAVGHDTLPETGEEDESMEVDVVDMLDEDNIHASLTEPASDLPPSLLRLSSVIKKENGTIIVEKLDTPAIRKERAQQRKKEKRLAEVAAQQMLSSSSTHLNMELAGDASPGAGPSRLPDQVSGEDVDVEIEVEAGSELSELSDAGSQGARSRVSRPKPPERTRVQPSRAKRSRAGAVREPGAIVLADDEMLEGGTLGMS